MLFSRLLKKKIINLVLNKKNKFYNEKLFKSNLKKLNKNNKKSSKFIIFLAINYLLPVFKLTHKKLRIKKLKLIKYKPIFILKNKNRIFFSIKLIAKNKKKNEFLFLNNPNVSIIAQKQILNNINVLTFYRWNF